MVYRLIRVSCDLHMCLRNTVHSVYMPHRKLFYCLAVDLSDYFSRPWAKRPDPRVNWAMKLRNHKANRDARMDDSTPTLSLLFIHFSCCFFFAFEWQSVGWIVELFGFNFVVDNGFCYIITRSSMWLLHHFPCFDVRHAPQASRPKYKVKTPNERQKLKKIKMGRKSAWRLCKPWNYELCFLGPSRLISY